MSWNPKYLSYLVIYLLTNRKYYCLTVFIFTSILPNELLGKTSKFTLILRCQDEKAIDLQVQLEG